MQIRGSGVRFTHEEGVQTLVVHGSSSRVGPGGLGPAVVAAGARLRLVQGGVQGASLGGGGGAGGLLLLQRLQDVR